MVFVNQPAQSIAPLHVKTGRRLSTMLWLGCLQLEPAVRPFSVVVVNVFVERSVEVSGRNDEEPVQTLLSHGANPALGIGVRPGSSKRGPNDTDPLGPEHLIKGS